MINNKLNIQLGAGDIILSGFVNTDLVRGVLPGIDMEVDVTKPLPWADNSVDIVVCAHTMDLIEKKDPVYKEIHRILKPGGWVRFVFGYRFENIYLGVYAELIQKTFGFSKYQLMPKTHTNTGDPEVLRACGMHAPNFIIELQK